ncbi:MAG: hypothetical protein E5X43_02290 [Mesorhizobium sp.]|nr:MAG: hypothetical protein E5X43_02290 [Mesorhizobium sp.]
MPRDSALDSAPLCPAGHLPHKWGDWPSSLISPTTNLAKRTLSAKLPISPQVGEMSGRTEGGAKDRYRSAFILGRCIPRLM